MRPSLDEVALECVRRSLRIPSGIPLTSTLHLPLITLHLLGGRAQMRSPIAPNFFGHPATSSTLHPPPSHLGRFHNLFTFSFPILPARW
jgi:hypothetical protein